MAFILFEEGVVVDYIPESERSEDNPAVIGIKYVSNSKTNSYVLEWNKRKERTKNREILRNIPHAMQRKQFIENIAYIRGFEREDGAEITSIEEFYDSAPANLIIELFAVMEDSKKLSEGQRKNLPGACDSDLSQAKTEAPSTVKIVPSETAKSSTVETGSDSGTVPLP